MTWRSVIFQSLASTALWGVGMTSVFGSPRETILLPMMVFFSIMFAILGTAKLIKQRRSGK